MSETKQRPADMSAEELEALIGQIVEAHLNKWPHESHKIGRRSSKVWESIAKEILHTAPGVPSALEMLLEERDQWNKGL